MRALLIAGLLVLAACGGDDDEVANSTAPVSTGSTLAPTTTVDGQPDCDAGEAEVSEGAEVPADFEGAASPLEAAELKMDELGRTETLVPTDDSTFAVVVDGKEVLVIETTPLENNTWVATATLRC